MGGYIDDLEKKKKERELVQSFYPVLISSHTFQLSMVDILSGANGPLAAKLVAVAFRPEQERVPNPPLLGEERTAMDWDPRLEAKHATRRNVHHLVSID